MKRKLLLALALLLCVACLAASAEERQFVPTAQWTPPDLSQVTSGSPPELLLLKVAQEELGYVEGPRNNQSKYGAWFSGRRVAWCAEFLAWCVDQADQRYGTQLTDNIYPHRDTSGKDVTYFVQKGRFIGDTGKLPSNEKQWLAGSEEYLKKDEYIPYPGDYILFVWYSRSRGTDHVAVVEGVSRDEDGAIQLHIIEGNNPDRVQRATVALTDKQIYGFGTPVKRAYSVLKLYNRNDDVAQLQKDLITLGYYKQEKNKEGVFTSKVRSALRTLQKDLDIPVTSVVDIATREAMEEALEESESKEP